MKLVAATAVFLLAQAAADLACKTDDDCAGDLQCAVQDDGYYAQCIDCSPDQFANDCQYWSDALLEAAEETCGISNCSKPVPPTPECATDEDCEGETNDCIVQADGLWAQCIDCGMNKTEFCNEEPYWSEPIREAAEARCEISCKPDAQCETDDDCEGETNDCVVQADGLWAQCIDCGMSQTEFSAECVYWSQPIIDAAEDRCEMSCAPPAQCASDDDCDGDLECAVQDNGLWAQCVPCDEETFTAQCVNWSDDIIAAAEIKCEQTCNKTLV